MLLAEKTKCGLAEEEQATPEEDDMDITYEPDSRAATHKVSATSLASEPDGATAPVSPPAPIREDAGGIHGPRLIAVMDVDPAPS